jgi:hypothetical protein
MNFSWLYCEYADDLVPLGEEEMVLQGVTD